MIVVGTFFPSFTVWKSRKDVNETNASVRDDVNNSAYNKELVSAAVEILLSLAASLIGLTLTSMMRSNPKSQPERSLAQLILLEFGHSFGTMLIAPTIVYMANSDLRKHFLEFYNIK